MDKSRMTLIEECRKRLLKERQARLNGIQNLRHDLSEKVSGDEGDMAQILEGQHASVSQRERMLRDLREIDFALSRMEQGMYGICEETGEPIEPNRLLAVPWTRLSLEGAELRELSQKRFA